MKKKFSTILIFNNNNLLCEYFCNQPKMWSDCFVKVELEVGLQIASKPLSQYYTARAKLFVRVSHTQFWIHLKVDSEITVY